MALSISCLPVVCWSLKQSVLCCRHHAFSSMMYPLLNYEPKQAFPPLNHFLSCTVLLLHCPLPFLGSTNELSHTYTEHTHMQKHAHHTLHMQMCAHSLVSNTGFVDLLQLTSSREIVICDIRNKIRKLRHLKFQRPNCLSSTQFIIFFGI